MPPPIASSDRRRYPPCMHSIILSILMLAGFALSFGGLYLIIRKNDPKHGWLMLIAGTVMFANVAIWSMPMEGAPTSAPEQAQ
jgi:hypothetical protein